MLLLGIRFRQNTRVATPALPLLSGSCQCWSVCGVMFLILGWESEVGVEVAGAFDRSAAWNYCCCCVAKFATVDLGLLRQLADERVRRRRGEGPACR